MNPVSCTALISHTSFPLGNQGSQGDQETPKPPGSRSDHSLDEYIPVITTGTLLPLEERPLSTGLSRPGSHTARAAHPEQGVVMGSTVCLPLHFGCTNWCQSRAQTPPAWRLVSAPSHPVTAAPKIHGNSPMCRAQLQPLLEQENTTSSITCARGGWCDRSWAVILWL